MATVITAVEQRRELQKSNRIDFLSVYGSDAYLGLRFDLERQRFVVRVESEKFVAQSTPLPLTKTGTRDLLP